MIKADLVLVFEIAYIKMLRQKINTRVHEIGYVSLIYFRQYDQLLIQAFIYVQLLFDKILGKSGEPKEVLLNTELVVRKSVKRLLYCGLSKRKPPVEPGTVKMLS